MNRACNMLGLCARAGRLVSGQQAVETALVMADGNKIKGRAIPVRIPYTLSACEEESPAI